MWCIFDNIQNLEKLVCACIGMMEEEVNIDDSNIHYTYTVKFAVKLLHDIDGDIPLMRVDTHPYDLGVHAH